MNSEPESLPDFLIIGAQKSGTSSLYAYLVKHPEIRRAAKKEIHYFDAAYTNRSLEWYSSFFPQRIAGSVTNGADTAKSLTGEATPYYIFHPHVARRVSESVPRVKLIAILRNPVDRAYSHYQMAIGSGRETLSFEDALTAEPKRLEGEVERMLADEGYRSIVYRAQSYMARGIYVDQLLRWGALFPKDQLLILRTEDLALNRVATVGKVFSFLGVPDREVNVNKMRNVQQYPPMQASTRQRLVEYFEPHNRRLYEYLGVDFEWR